MHYGGFPCDIQKIKKICSEKKIFLIEDSCHALFSEFKNKKLGTFGDVGVFSFYGNKNMSTGEGGMILSKKKIISTIRKMSSHGIDLTSTKRIKFKKLYYNIKSPGLNYRIDDIRSAIGYNELNYLNKKNHKRYLLYKNYLNLIKNSTLSDKVIIPFSEKASKNFSYHLFPLILKKIIKKYF